MVNADRRRLIPAQWTSLLARTSEKRTPIDRSSVREKRRKSKLDLIISLRKEFIHNASFSPVNDFRNFSKTLTLKTYGQWALGYDDLFKKFQPKIQDWLRFGKKTSMMVFRFSNTSRFPNQRFCNRSYKSWLSEVKAVSIMILNGTRCKLGYSNFKNVSIYCLPHR